MKIAILQSNYIPWKGVFDMINMVDTFVFFEDVDFTKRDWRSRNKIPTPNGELWLTVPVVKSPRGTKIMDIEISQTDDWQSKHYANLRNNYIRAKFFKDFEWLLRDFYIERHWTNLSEMNIYMTKKISEILGISTAFLNSKDIPSNGSKDDKLIDICKYVGATAYLSGPAAKDYIHVDKFKDNGIGLSYIKYDTYPEYKQIYGDFNHYVSIFDVLFNCGDEAPKYIFQGKEEIVC